MITSIEIDGFKSLRNFKMEFRKGLNVLAGPNGSGKTNILQALEFLNYLTKGSVRNAVEFCSDSFGDIFYRGGEALIKFKILGYDNFSDLRIEDEEVVLVEPNDYAVAFEIVSNKVTYVARLLSFTYRGDSMLPHLVDNEEYESLNFIPGHLVTTTLLNQALIDAFECSVFDLSPLRLRSVAYKSTKYKLGKDGIGFANALDYSIEGHVYWNINKEMLLDYFNLLSIDIEDYKAIKRSSSNELDIDVSLLVDGRKEDFSIRSLSDGILSWMALSVALTQHEYGWCFDEPDRHLHPDMLRKMVSLFREHAEDGPGWLLMTTHNETVLNQCHLEEIQLVELNEQGHTTVRPVRDIPGMRQLIHDLGGQPGYHYVHGNL